MEKQILPVEIFVYFNVKIGIDVSQVLKSLQYSLHFHEISFGQIYKKSTIMHLQCDLVVRQIFSDEYLNDND